MDVRSAILNLINAIPGKWVVAAAHLGMTENSLRNRAYETKGQSLSTDHALALQQLTGGTDFAEAIAVASGGTFVKLPEAGEIENESIQLLFNENYAELGKLFNAFIGAIEDNKIDSNERQKLEALGAQLHRKTETLLAVMFSVYCPRANTVRAEPLREVA
ncbi:MULTISPECIES: YmfL family putative regulatory protein [unclassified Duganella]|uniref:YmfL family putative regulatory protein n=1 Tax=unclassified Duganella TaxID=2636909 RepID=UPI000888CC95|nr:MULTISPECIES: YmfL family putative regulatory protein [unclassified Duganella]SDH05530.1 hypothetical protein SAMN05216320_109129 [Duganella sp. OV458]SDK20612.1 hypothetical protein SAMN05428973_109153 [Duganella sp. OV510]